MLSYDEFEATVRKAVPRFATGWLNKEQDDAVRSPLHPPTFIVAGPGAGKTTVLVLRVLKLMLVDGLGPETIIATTFTRKAAAELRSRILSWGFAIVELAKRNAAKDRKRSEWLAGLDINQISVGTLDSLAEQYLRDNRPPGAIVPATIEGFLARGLMRRHVFWLNNRYRDAQLEAYLNQITPHFPQAYSLGDKLTVALAFADRCRHDCLDLRAFAKMGIGQAKLTQIVTDYRAHLDNNHLADFARLEELLFNAIKGGGLKRVTTPLKAIVVDEFQDTNFLQEKIYIELCRQSGAGLTVVGDDDQSIFRFRGATIEIFANFEKRIVAELGRKWKPLRVDLHRNYRSTERVVSFCDHFLHLDSDYQGSRAPGKKRLIASASHATHPDLNVPVLGMFRSDVQTLAADLSLFLQDVFRGSGRQINCSGKAFTITAAKGGDYGDAVLLAAKVREESSTGRPRLPLLLRQELASRAIRVFNPRGRSLGSIDDVQRLLGLALECIDPNASLQSTITSIRQDERTRLMQWRQAAQAFIATNPAPGGLPKFVRDWQARRKPGGGKWPPEWPVLELIFTLVAWFPQFQRDPEGQVYLEAIARTVGVVGQMAPYGAQILRGAGPHDDRSVIQVIREVFESIAGEHIDVDEEIMPRVPRTYFPIMTVHQAKGLEFPLVVADVGSDFKTNHHTQARFRFPSKGDSVHVVEDEVAAHSPIGSQRTSRTVLQRAWDDLRRLYFVAYSRPENVLLLAGLTSQLATAKPVRSVSTGDRADSTRHIQFVPAAQWTPSDPPSVVALI